MAKKVVISFKDSFNDTELFDFLNKQGEVIGKGAYIKLLLKREKEKKLKQ